MNDTLSAAAQRLDLELTARGFSDRHAAALGLLMPDSAEREGIAVYIARNLV